MRKRLGIVLDYGLRIPPFKETFFNLKKLLCEEYPNLELEGIDIPETYWGKVFQDKVKRAFYETVTIPTDEKQLDITWQTYFQDQADLQQFVEDYAFLLFAGGSINQGDVKYVNLTQTHLVDVYLFDRLTTNRKASSTYHFLSKSGLLVKGIEFIKPEATAEQIMEQRNLDYLWDAYSNKELVITNTTESNMLKLLEQIEQDLKKKK